MTFDVNMKITQYYMTTFFNAHINTSIINNLKTFKYIFKSNQQQEEEIDGKMLLASLHHTIQSNITQKNDQ